MSSMTPEDGSSSISSSPLHLFSLMSLSPGIGSPYPWLREMESEERGLYLIQYLVACANHVAAGSLEKANIGLEQINHLASADGDTMQRIASYFTEAFANRMLKTWPGLYKAINSTKITSVSEEILVKRLFFDLCPFLRLSYLITNQAILESMEGEKMVHIIDLCSSEPEQWINLLQSLKTRPEGPPHVRITGIHQQKEVLEQMAIQLNQEAEKFCVFGRYRPWSAFASLSFLSCYSFTFCVVQELTWTSKRLEVFFSGGGDFLILCGLAIFFMPYNMKNII